MPVNGNYYDLDNPTRNIENAIIRENGNEIAFDMKLEGYQYTVTLCRNNGTLFQGEAISQPGNEKAQLACRVFEDRTQGLTVILGHQWRYPNGTNSSWLVELELELE